MPGAVSGELGPHNLGARKADGWSAIPVGNAFSAPVSVFFQQAPVGISRDLETWWWESGVPYFPGAPVSPDEGLYNRQLQGGLTLLGYAGSRGTFQFLGGSDDGRRAIFQTTDRLLEPDVARREGHGVYEFDGQDLRLVSVADDGSLLSPCGAAIAGSEAMHPISRDGRRIVLTSPESTSDTCPVTRRVYLREDGAVTKEASASRCTRPDCDAAQDVLFAGATPDGASIFMDTTQQLTNDDLDEGRDLYRYDLATGTLKRISAGPPGVVANVRDAEVKVSDDGARVYFLAAGTLVPGKGTDGASNLYLADGDELRFVAALGSDEGWTAFVDPDGGRLVLSTLTALDPADTDTAQDIYLYDVDADTFTRVSGVGAGNGNGSIDAGFPGTGNAITGQPLHYLTDDGRRVFLSTSEPLVPEDTNDLTDVYEWADGSLGLITSGAHTEQLTYGGASANGRSVFFITDESLTWDDTDDGDLDVYAARLGGGFERVVPVPCAGDDCQGAITGRITRPPVPTSTEHGETSHPLDELTLKPIGAAARRRIAATGRMTVVVETPVAGRLSVHARARIGHRTRTVARGATRATRPGTMVLHLRLSAAARRRLEHGQTLRLRLVLRHSKLGAAPTLSVALKRAR